MISLFASDLTRMVTFYREVLGVEIDWDGEVFEIGRIARRG